MNTTEHEHSAEEKGKVGNIFYSQQTPSYHNKTCAHSVDLQNLWPRSLHLFQLMGATAAICNFMM